MRTLVGSTAALVLLLFAAACTRSNDRALGQALMDGRWQDARDLVRNGASIDAPQSVRFGEPILARLATMDKVEGVKVALELGADPNRADYIGRTPLMFAAWKNQLETMRILITAGADVNAWAAGGRSAIGAAKYEKHDAAVAVLLAAGARDDAPRRLFP